MKTKIRCLLRIFKKETVIIEVEFFNHILLPNLILEGTTIISDSGNINHNNQMKKGKEIIIHESKDFSKTSTQYRIECILDKSELPDEIVFNNTFSWSIKVFSTDTIGFIKDTSKEDAEKALIQSWEHSEPGRSLKAQQVRIKYIEERKNLISNYISKSPEKKSKK